MIAVPSSRRQNFAHAGGFNASGTLRTPSGGQLSYQGTARYVVQSLKDGSEDVRFVPAVEKVSLR